MRSMYLIILALSLGWLSGCAAYNPVAVAETPEQKADAMYDTFLAYKQQAVNLARAPGTPQTVINALAKADRVVSPIMDSLQDAVIAVERVRADLSAGSGTEELLTIATLNLEKWLYEAAPAVQALIDAVATAKSRAAVYPGRLSEAALEWRLV